MVLCRHDVSVSQNPKGSEKIPCASKGQEESTHERRNHDANDKCYNIGPCLERDVFLEHNDETKNEAPHENNEVPPPWHFLVVFDHMLMVTVVIASGLRTYECSLDVTTPEEDDVCYQSTNLSMTMSVRHVTTSHPTHPGTDGTEDTYRCIGHQHGVGKATRQPG